MKSLSVTIRIKVTDQYFHVVLFSNAVQSGSKAVLTFASVDEIFKCDHSNESY